MKILAVVSGLVVLVTLALLSHYNRAHFAEVGLAVNPAAGRPTHFDPSPRPQLLEKSIYRWSKRSCHR